MSTITDNPIHLHGPRCDYGDCPEPAEVTLAAVRGGQVRELRPMCLEDAEFYCRAFNDHPGTFSADAIVHQIQPLTIFPKIAQDETPYCGTNHRWPDDIAGYVLVLTRSGEGRIRDVAMWDDSTKYGEVIEMRRELRDAIADNNELHIRTDVLYNDGCRGIL